MTLLNRRDAAKELGISERSVGRWRSQLIELGAATVQGGVTLYESEGLAAAYASVCGLQATNAATVERLQRVVSTHQQVEPSIDEDDTEGEDVPPWAKSKARREHFLAEKEQLALARLQGSLVDRDAVKKLLFEQGRALRDELQRFAILLPPELRACEGDIPSMQQLLQVRVNDLLTNFAQGTEAGIAAQQRRQAVEAVK